MRLELTKKHVKSEALKAVMRFRLNRTCKEISCRTQRGPAAWPSSAHHHRSTDGIPGAVRFST
eukprot:2246419-Pleurochrysis_carterae.AAC.4